MPPVEAPMTISFSVVEKTCVKRRFGVSSAESAAAARRGRGRECEAARILSAMMSLYSIKPSRSPSLGLVTMATAQNGKWICNEARDLLAGNGLLLENHVVRHMTDMEVVSTYEGTDSIQALLVGRDITGISAFS